MANTGMDKSNEMVHDGPSLGKLLREYRKKAGLTQLKVAERLNSKEIDFPVVNNTLSNYERGERFPEEPRFILEYVKCLGFHKDLDEKCFNALIFAWVNDQSIKIVNKAEAVEIEYHGQKGSK